jgi:glycosyltransferase involved in cell wall biosynthesis
VARTSRALVEHARSHDLPLLCVHPDAAAGERNCDYRRVPLRNSIASFPVDADMVFDAAFLRHRNRLRNVLDEFRPEVLHVTSPGQCGILGVLLAHERKLPLVMSWHTNLHEFAARRVMHLLRWLPGRIAQRLAAWCEQTALDATLRYYRLGHYLLAPNPHLIAMLRERTGRQTARMGRGVDTTLFTPARRGRANHDQQPGLHLPRWPDAAALKTGRTSDIPFRGEDLMLGFVGRLTPEKNVRLLPEIERALILGGLTKFRFLIVGEGGDRAWLERTLNRAMFRGVLRGEALADAYASMDLFLFPSRTDTFGNVVQEALASGVPALVSREGGPQFVIRPGETGLLADTADEFAHAIVQLASDPGRRAQMRAAARQQALGSTWSAVFDQVWQGYARAAMSYQQPALGTVRNLFHKKI